MKKLWCLLIVVVMVLALFAGCGKDGDSGGGTTTGETEGTTEAVEGDETEEETDAEPEPLSGKITLAIWNGQKIEEFEADAQAFMDANPGTEIEIEFIEAVETIKTRMAANELPDIAQVPNDMLISELPDFYAALDDVGFTEDNYYFYGQGLGEDGHLYKITNMISFNGVIYNKKVFRDCGITEIPSTLDEFYEVCEQIKENGIVPFATNFKDRWPLGGYSIRGTLAQARSGDPNATNDLVNMDNLMSGPFLENLEFLRTMKEKGLVEPDLMSTDWGAFWTDISEGNVAMTYLGSWAAPAIEVEEDRGMFPFPDAKYVEISKDWYMGIDKNSDALDLAKAYFKHLFLTDKTWCDILEYCSAVKGVEYPFNFITELTSYGVPLLETTPMSNDVQAIVNEMAVDFDDITQEYVLTDDPQSVIEKYNQKWAAARKALGY